ncbi:MAG TPA: tetratricopeptide repeat protein [Gemmataceae bacterium]|nr:tetratricopeptide repeat protein [Gemmataceae bacterium]
MDCRRMLVVALGLLAVVGGCVPSAGLPSLASDSEHPRRQPKASTCISLARLSEEAAADPRISPAEQERLRDRAREAYQEALKVDANNLDALTSLAYLYTTMNDHEHAVATYARAVKSHPKNAALYHAFGMCHAQCKEWEPAIANLRQAVALAPEERLYAHSLGFCLARVGKFDDSYAVFAKVDGAASAHYDLARMFHHLEQDDKAKEHLQLALQAKPDFLPAKQMLSVLETPGTTAGRAAALDVIENLSW